MRKRSDEICRQRGLSVIEKPRGKTPRSIYLAEKRGEPTKYNLMRQAIDEAVSMSTNMEMFEYVLRKKGYRICMDQNRKYPVIRSIYGGKATRLYQLGEEYEASGIQKRVYENDESVRRRYYGFIRDTGTVIRPSHTRIRTKRPKQKITGLYALYLHYLYLLGYRPKREHYQPLTPEMKQALRKCDEYSRQAGLLAREHLSTEDDVQNLIRRTDDKITSLCERRQKIYNKLRRCQDPEQIGMLKGQRNELTEEITVLRKDRKTAVNILNRAEKIRSDVAREYMARKQMQRTKSRER